MPEYIERSGAADYFEKSKQTMWHKDDVAATLSGKSIPAADAEVVRRGRWADYECDEPYGPYDTKAWYKCSECGEDAFGRCWDDEWYSSPILSDYCPLCGAKMDGKGESE